MKIHPPARILLYGCHNATCFLKKKCCFISVVLEWKSFSLAADNFSFPGKLNICREASLQSDSFTLFIVLITLLVRSFRWSFILITVSHNFNTLFEIYVESIKQFRYREQNKWAVTSIDICASLMQCLHVRCLSQKKNPFEIYDKNWI